MESLVNDCGLSDAEAALMIRLHQREEEKPRQQWRQATVSPVGGSNVSREVPDAEASDLGDGAAEALPSESPLTSEEIRLQESLAAAQSR